jgi:outer membrane protein assembly factor BamB
MRICLLTLLSLSLTAFVAADDNWTQFRGPRGSGRADSAKLPITWSEKKNTVWKTAIHDKGWSSPVIWGDQVWLTTAKADGSQLFAVCVDRDKGNIVHDVKLFDVDHPSELWKNYNSFASPTPAIEEGRVYVHFGTYGSACLDAKTGKTVWQRGDLHCDHWRGAASSPILFGDSLFLTFDGYDVQYVIALDKRTGSTLWKKDRAIDYKTTNGDLKKAFGTPSLLTIDSTPQFVSPAAMATIAYDPNTGDELWKVNHGGMNVTTPPLYGGGKLFLCTGDGGLRLLAVRPGRGDITDTNIDWSVKKPLVPSRSSPILVDGLLYMVNEAGIVSCVEAKTGELVWQERLGGKYWASPIHASGRLYFFDEAGAGHVIAAGRKWHKLATNHLDDGCRASPAVSGYALYFRTLTNLYRF